MIDGLFRTREESEAWNRQMQFEKELRLKLPYVSKTTAIEHIEFLKLVASGQTCVSDGQLKEIVKDLEIYIKDSKSTKVRG